MYEHLGLLTWVTEFWSPMRRAGSTDYEYIELVREHPVEDDLELLLVRRRARRRATSTGIRSSIRSSARSSSGGGT